MKSVIIDALKGMNNMEKIIKVNYTAAHIPNLKGTVRIANLADIHFEKNVTLEKVKKAFTLVGDYKPDYICLLGDNIDSTNVIDDPTKKQEFLDLMTYSGSIAPTMISLADHDQRFYDSEGNGTFDFREGFWKEVGSIPNVHVLNNEGYEDDKVRFLGYTLPSYYYTAKYPLPEDSWIEETREDEDINVLLEDLSKNQELLDAYLENPDSKYTALLFHSPQMVTDPCVAYQLRGFNHVFSGHMHEGCMPPILDDIIPSSLGLISPQRSLFPHNSRGIIRLGYGNLCIINGGITKIHGSANKILQPFNKMFPMHIDIVDATGYEVAKRKEYTRKSTYKYVK